MNPSPVIVVPNAILERPSGRRKLRTSPYDCITSCPIPCLENAVTCPTQPSADLDVARCVASPCLVHISRLVSHRKWDTAPPALVSRLLSYSHSERLLISTLVNSDQRSKNFLIKKPHSGRRPRHSAVCRISWSSKSSCHFRILKLH